MPSTVSPIADVLANGPYNARGPERYGIEYYSIHIFRLMEVSILFTYRHVEHPVLERGPPFRFR
jgi:hypothetical protein